jgi:hypothetical protein
MSSNVDDRARAAALVQQKYRFADGAAIVGFLIGGSDDELTARQVDALLQRIARGEVEHTAGREQLLEAVGRVVATTADEARALAGLRLLARLGRSRREPIVDAAILLPLLSRSDAVASAALAVGSTGFLDPSLRDPALAAAARLASATDPTLRAPAVELLVHAALAGGDKMTIDNYSTRGPEDLDAVRRAIARQPELGRALVADDAIARAFLGGGAGRRDLDAADLLIALARAGATFEETAAQLEAIDDADDYAADDLIAQSDRRGRSPAADAARALAFVAARRRDDAALRRLLGRAPHVVAAARETLAELSSIK